MNSFLKKYKLYLLLFISLILIFNIYFLINNIYPYGDNTLIRIDLYFQYYPMIVGIKDNILRGNFGFDFSTGLGLPIYRTIFNYLLSPFNLLFLIIKDHILGINIVLVSKIMMLSFSMLYYLKRKFSSNDILLLIPSLLYGLSGWICAYSWNLMWLDALIMLPFITIGIEKLIDEKNIGYYSIVLGITIILNFYMGYILCFYSLLYFLAYNLYRIKTGSLKYKINELSRNFLIFLGGSFLGVLLSSIILLPTYYASTTMGAKYSYFDGNSYSFSLVEFIASHLAFTKSTILYSPKNPVAPNIYSGVLSLLLLGLFVVNKKINKKDKWFYLGLLITWLLFFFIPILDYIINMFHVPAGLPYRYSYFYIFIMLIIMSYELLNDNQKSLKSGIIISILLIILSLISMKSPTRIDSNMIIYNIILIIGYFILYVVINKKWSRYVLVLVVCIELLFNLSIGSNINIQKISSLNNDIESNTNLYRVAEKDSVYPNKGLLNRYYAVDLSNSMEYSYVFEYLSSLGLETDYSAKILYKDYNPVINMLLNIDKIYDRGMITDNDYILSLMFRINKSDYEYDYNNSPFITQNDLIESMTGINDLYKEVKPISKKLVYEDDILEIYEYQYDKNTYATINPSNMFYFKNGDYIYSLYKMDEDISKNRGLDKLELRFYNYRSIIKLDETVEVAYYKKSIDKDDNWIYSYKLNTKKLDEVYQKLNKDLVDITYDGKTIKGKINNSEDGIMYTSIPYDKGWEVYIDNKRVDSYSLYNTLLSFDIPKGEHEIELKYHIPYLAMGLGCTIGSLVVICLLSRKRY